MFRLPRFSQGLSNVSAGMAAMISQSVYTLGIIVFVRLILGTEALGLWAIYSSIIIMMSLTEFGIGASMVSLSQKDAKSGELAGYYSTSLWSAIAISFLVTFPFAVLAIFKLPDLVGEKYYLYGSSADVIGILIAGVVMAANKVPANLLNGLGHYASYLYLRVITYLVFLPISWFAIKYFGIFGLIVTRVILEIFLLVAAQFVVFFRRLNIPLFPGTWNLTYFKNTIGRAINFQASSFLLLFFEPIAKAGTTVVGGLDATAMYEVLARLSGFVKEICVRPLFYASGQIAQIIKTGSTEKLRSYLEGLFKLGFVLALGSFGSLLAFGFLGFDFLLGHSNEELVLYLLVVGFGWAIAVLATGAYFYCLGSGDNSSYLIASIIILIVISVFVACAIFLEIFYLIPIGAGLSLAIGEITLLMLVQKKVRFSIGNVLELKVVLSGAVYLGLCAVIGALDNAFLSDMRILLVRLPILLLFFLAVAIPYIVLNRKIFAVSLGLNNAK